MAINTTPISESLKQKLSSTVYALEATDFEVFSLWNMYSKNSTVTHDLHKKVNFSPDLQGYVNTIGDIYGNEVSISLSFMTVEDKTILFYCPISETVSYAMINKWLTDNCQAYKDGKTTDPVNFQRMLDELAELK